MIADEYQIPGARVIEHETSAPLDWRSPSAHTEKVWVFSREIVSTAPGGGDRPYLLFLQGGPGHASPRPLSARDGWLRTALERYRVVLLDQRGTGRSGRVSARTLERFDSVEAARDYLLCLRADSIVADCELLRREEYGVDRWQTLGQSYGGFLTLTYLSQAPEGLAACLVTGGLASIRPDASEVYRRTVPRAERKTAAYYAHYPQDRAALDEIADVLARGDVRLPDGDRLTVRRLQMIGMGLGMLSAPQRLHWLLDGAWEDPHNHAAGLAAGFLAQVSAMTSYDDAPLYLTMQESIYGSGHGAPQWAAARELARHPEFAEDARPLQLFGEVALPWMFEDIRSLRPFRDVAQELAEWEDWTDLYDPERLAANEVPVVAAVYFDDLYVDRELSLQTAAEVRGVHAWVTNELEHDGLRTGHSLQHLLAELDDAGGPRP